MKPIRIFVLPSHASKERTSGVDFARIIQPMKHLAKEKDFKVTIYDPKINEKMDWREVAANNDIIYLNYTTNPWAFAAMGCFARKNKRKIVLDIDDALWLCRPDNFAYQSFKPGSEGIRNLTAICNEVDYITTTSSYLRNVICHYTYKTHDKVAIMPNCIDLNLYRYRFPAKEQYPFTVCHFGSSSHYQDLQDSGVTEGMERLMRDFPNVNLVTVGALIPRFNYKWGARYRHDFGDVDVYKWIKEKFPKFMEEADIVVAPLEVDVYNRAKSYIKFLEYSSAMKPGVYQEITPYEEIVVDGENGFLARRAEDWYQKMKRLAESVSLRKKIGEKAFETIQEHTIQKNIFRYADFFRKIMS